MEIVRPANASMDAKLSFLNGTPLYDQSRMQGEYIDEHAPLANNVRAERSDSCSDSSDDGYETALAQSICDYVRTRHPSLDMDMKMSFQAAPASMYECSRMQGEYVPANMYLMNNIRAEDRDMCSDSTDSKYEEALSSTTLAASPSIYEMYAMEGENVRSKPLRNYEEAEEADCCSDSMDASFEKVLMESMYRPHEEKRELRHKMPRRVERSDEAVRARRPLKNYVEAEEMDVCSDSMDYSYENAMRAYFAAKKFTSMYDVSRMQGEYVSARQMLPIFKDAEARDCCSDSMDISYELTLSNGRSVPMDVKLSYKEATCIFEKARVEGENILARVMLKNYVGAENSDCCSDSEDFAYATSLLQYAHEMNPNIDMGAKVSLKHCSSSLYECARMQGEGNPHLVPLENNVFAEATDMCSDSMDTAYDSMLLHAC